MKKYIIIEADTNDGDYITQRSSITDADIEKIKPVINEIKNFKKYKGKSRSGFEITHSHNFPVGECGREDLGEKNADELYSYIPGFEIFKRFIPCGEMGIHTISNICIDIENEILL